MRKLRRAISACKSSERKTSGAFVPEMGSRDNTLQNRQIAVVFFLGPFAKKTLLVHAGPIRVIHEVGPAQDSLRGSDGSATLPARRPAAATWPCRWRSPR